VTKIEALKAFNDNYIWTWSQNNNTWVVDPGDAAPVIEYLEKNRSKLAGILLTHHHADHSGGIAELVKRWPQCAVTASHKSPIKEITHRVHEGDRVACGPFTFTALEIPGHTLDHVAFYDESHLFSGDTLFSAGCGKVFEGTVDEMYTSLMKLFNLSDQTNIYCGHEYTLANLQFAEVAEPENNRIKTKLAEVEMVRAAGKPTLPALLQDERLYNPFLRCKEPTIKKSVEATTQKNLSDPVQVFAALRAWKNNFRGITK